MITQDIGIATFCESQKKLLFSNVISLHSPYKYLKTLERRLDSEAATRAAL